MREDVAASAGARRIGIDQERIGVLGAGADLLTPPGADRSCESGDGRPFIMGRWGARGSDDEGVRYCALIGRRDPRRRGLVCAHRRGAEIAYEIDKEVRRIIDECYSRARAVLTEHKETLERIAKALLEWESLRSDELDTLIAGQPLLPDLPTLALIGVSRRNRGLGS